ncbi:glycosyl hydrolase [Sphingomonas tabacisoli]|uniref:Glycosyl hydrolase n=1 Tax=Sphingomonas tabacisoli TaxID=2249466 RepID=A0ABW4I4B8_9SPHN
MAPGPQRQAHLLAALLFASSALHPLSGAELNDPLAQGFANPPQSARPRVWWHWMNGNITRDGIARDLDWMRRVGIGGVQNFDADLGTPQIVDKRLVYMHPDWKDAFRFAVEQADHKGLEFAIASSPGWSETGGPWVQPKDGLKKLVWSETLATGGKRFSGKLPAPPSITGPFQTLPLSDPLAAVGGAEHKAPPTFYADVAVLAYPVSDVGPEAASVVQSSKGPVDPAPLVDDSLETGTDVPRGGTVTLTYAAPRTIRSATFFAPGEASVFTDPTITPVLEARDGKSWRKLAKLPVGDVPTTVSFAPVTAREFRVVLGPYSGPQRIGLGEGAPGAVPINFFPPPAPDKPVKIAELRLSAEAKIDRFEAKAGYAIARDYYALSAGVPEQVGVASKQVVDLTDRMKADGTLEWTPPKGKWRIVRLGYSLLGTTNHPAPEEATGLEVDKFDGAAVRQYLQTYLGMYRDAAGADMIGRRGIRALLTDSIEVGAANWTPRMVEQFKRLRGYDPTPFLPTLTGAIIGSRSDSDRFLYDYRRTLADLMASEHYGTVAAVAHENGLKVYGEALEDVRPSLGDDMTMRKYADVPMAALWTWNREGLPRPTLIGDMRGAASVAHLYGQNIVAAESMTAAQSPWAFAPADLRRIIDLEFASGVNRPVIHTSVHQPTDDKLPGLSLAIFGQYFNRHETWAEMAKPWVDYIARTSFMLQQGRNFADVAYFYGEEAPLTALYAEAPLADTPKRYAFDFVNPDALLNQLSVEGNELVVKSGVRYKALYLGGTSRQMTVPVLRRIAEFADAGVTIIGDAPEASPGLKDDKLEFDALVRRIWMGGANVIAGQPVEAGLGARGIAPDFSYSGEAELLFVHRKLADGDAYFLTNRRDRAAHVEARFRVSRKAPEIWRADTGAYEPVSYRIEGAETIVPLNLAADDSFFVVFRKPATTDSLTVAQPAAVSAVTLDGPWSVSFEPGRGAPGSTVLDALVPLSNNADPGIKYFSGVATYAKTIPLPKDAKPGRPLLLDLGRVGDLAEVWVNGSQVGTVWHAPYRIDIGSAVRAGKNTLQVRVADLWVNRLIGDAQPGAKMIAWTALPTYRPDAPLRPSGLIGPVQLLVENGK